MRYLATAAVIAALSITAASAQTTTPSTTTPAPAGGTPAGGTTASPPASGPDSGKAAASGNDNQAVATTAANADTPAKGANSFTMGQAATRIASHGFSAVTGLKKDPDGVWRGQASKSGQQVAVWLDYKGNVGQQ